MNISLIMLAVNGCVPQVTRGHVPGDPVWKGFQNWLLSGGVNWTALRRISDSVQSWTLLCWIHDNAIRPSEGPEAFCILDCRGVQQCTLLCGPEARHLCHCFCFFFKKPFGFSVYFSWFFLKSLFWVQFCSQNFPDGDGFQVPTYPHHIRTSVSLLAQ